VSYYLIDHPPASPQFYRSRANPVTGGVLIHTTESPSTSSPWNTAAFISRRTDPGSYHTIVSDTEIVPLMPWSWTAFHCAANGYNSRTFGVSINARASELSPDDPFTLGALRQTALVLVRFWLDAGMDPLRSAVVRPAAELLTGPGIATHGDAQPWDRSDAWTRNPRRLELERILLEEIRSIVKPVPPSPGGEPVKPELHRDAKDGTVWLVYPNTPWRTHVKSPDDIRVWMFFGVPYKGDMAPEFAAFLYRNTQWVRTG
jgi:hypothetical protein